jgi:hypothetical protein
MLATDDLGVTNHTGLTYRESLSLQQCGSEKLQSRTSVRESDKRRLVHASDCLPSCDNCYPRSAFFCGGGWGGGGGGVGGGGISTLRKISK